MCSDSQDDELYELVKRNYNEVNGEYLREQMEHALSYMSEDDRRAWKIRMDEIFKENA